jgi:hypothetical protein
MIAILAVRRLLCAAMAAFTTLVMPANAGGQGRDSAGVRIIDNDRPVWTPANAVRLASAPAVVIGTGDGEAHELSSVEGAIRLGDGTIVVADGTTSQLRFFDATGKHVRSVGRRGGGPGEFNQLRMLAKLAGDTIVAGDGLRSLSFFTGTGTFIRTARTALPPTPDRPVLTVILAVLDDQSTVVAPISNPAPRAAGARWTETVPLSILDRAGGNAVSLGTHPYWVFAMYEGQAIPVRFSEELMVTTNGRELFVGFGAQYAIRVFSKDGRLQRIIHRRWTPTRVASGETDRYAEAWGKRWIRATGAEYDRQLREFRQNPFAEVVPAISQIIADRSGRLWVREARVADASATGSLGQMPLVPSTWNVFDTAGRWLGNVTTPPRLFVQEIGADYLLGIASDSDGVQTVVMYRLEGGR